MTAVNGMKGARLFWTLALATPAVGQELAVQTLDRVEVNSVGSVLEMAFSDPRRMKDFTDTGIAGSAFRSCSLTAIAGLYCLDGRVVRNWRSTADPSASTTVVDCTDPVLRLDARHATPCTALTAESSGTLWLAGKGNGKSHSLIRVVSRTDSGTCPAGFAALALTDACADEVVGGRPLLVDLVSIDGETADAFVHGSGLLALEERKAAVFYPTAGTPIVVADGKQAWGLQGNEELLSVALLQVPDGLDTTRSYVLATTSSGRILSIDVTGGAGATQVFDLHAERNPVSAQCSFAEPMYGIRASGQSGLVYVTDRQFCQVLALQPVVNQGVFAGLENAREPVFDPAGNPAGFRDLTLATADGPSTVFPPEGPTVAPGIAIDLDDCAGSCALVLGADGKPAATLSNVVLASQESGLTLFQVQNIPDCRYAPQPCRDLLGVQDLVQAGVIVDPQATGDPAAQLLNVTPLLPREITDLFAGEGGLPDLLVSRQYRGQKASGFFFDAFFGVTEDGVVFRDNFQGEFDVAALAGAELGCSLNLPPESPLFTENAGQPNARIGTLEWDVLTSVSERVPTFTDPVLGPGPQFVDTLVNNDCGSSRSIGTRWSLKPYNLEITPCTWNGDTGDVWASDGSCPVGGPEIPDDAVFAKLVLALYDDLHAALNQLACADVDGGGAPPLSASSCSTLNAAWLNGKDKLDKCWSATQQPKTSAGDQNCQAFVSQFTSFSNSLAAASGPGADPANRRGELRARVETLMHVYEERFVPSIPAGAFVEP